MGWVGLRISIGEGKVIDKMGVHCGKSSLMKGGFCWCSTEMSGDGFRDIHMCCLHFLQDCFQDPRRPH